MLLKQEVADQKDVRRTVGEWVALEQAQRCVFNREGSLYLSCGQQRPAPKNCLAVAEHTVKYIVRAEVASDDVQVEDLSRDDEHVSCCLLQEDRGEASGDEVYDVRGLSACGTRVLM